MQTTDQLRAKVAELRERGECLAKAGMIQQAAKGPDLVAECLGTLVDLIERAESAAARIERAAAYASGNSGNTTPEALIG